MVRISGRRALGVGLVIAAAPTLAGAQALQREWTQLPTPPIVREVAPGVGATADPDVFVLRNGGAEAGAADGAPCPEIPLRYWTGAPTTACQCFAVGEEAGVIFQAPASHYPLDVLKVNIAWGTAGAVCDMFVPDLQGAINFYLAGPPAPFSSPDKTLKGPALYCGAINTFDLPLLGVAPLRVNSGKFTVTLEFDEATNQQPYPRTIVHDGNGCQTGRNVVKVLPISLWLDACQLGVSGDWAFEVVYRRVTCPCPGDINGDRMVDFFDLNGVLSQYGQVGVGLTADVNGDGRVDFSDLNIVLSAFGQPC